MLSGKKILLGVTGSISAYKSVFLTRLLVQSGAEVKVVMTNSAKDFVTPLTFATLSKNPVIIDFIKDNETGIWENHVELGSWADLLIIAPASANTIAKMISGLADNVLLAVWLSAKCETLIVPAMDHDMFHHFTTQNNIQQLKKNGVAVVHPNNGELASGLIGDGRLAEPEEILQKVKNYFSSKLFDGKLKEKKILITAGPTYEDLDPVRFIGNYSTGKMGFALAEEANKAGAVVTLICGPTTINFENKSYKKIKVRSAFEMHEAVMKEFAYNDIIIMAAAIADYTPVQKSNSKIKKQGEKLVLELEKTTDILKALGKVKEQRLLIGFALETDNEIENATMKLKDKNADFIVLNSLNDNGAGFGYDTNKITIIGVNNKPKKFSLLSKQETAHEILHVVSQNI